MLSQYTYTPKAHHVHCLPSSGEHPLLSFHPPHPTETTPQWAILHTRTYNFNYRGCPLSPSPYLSKMHYEGKQTHSFPEAAVRSTPTISDLRSRMHASHISTDPPEGFLAPPQTLQRDLAGLHTEVKVLREDFKRNKLAVWRSMELYAQYQGDVVGRVLGALRGVGQGQGQVGSVEEQLHKTAVHKANPRRGASEEALHLADLAVSHLGVAQQRSPQRTTTPSPGSPQSSQNYAGSQHTAGSVREREKEKEKEREKGWYSKTTARSSSPGSPQSSQNYAGSHHSGRARGRSHSKPTTRTSSPSPPSLPGYADPHRQRDRSHSKPTTRSSSPGAVSGEAKADAVRATVCVQGCVRGGAATVFTTGVDTVAVRKGTQTRTFVLDEVVSESSQHLEQVMWAAAHLRTGRPCVVAVLADDVDAGQDHALGIAARLAAVIVAEAHFDPGLYMQAGLIENDTLSDVFAKTTTPRIDTLKKVYLHDTTGAATQMRFLSQARRAKRGAVLVVKLGVGGIIGGATVVDLNTVQKTTRSNQGTACQAYCDTLAAVRAQHAHIPTRSSKLTALLSSLFVKPQPHHPSQSQGNTHTPPAAHLFCVGLGYHTLPDPTGTAAPSAAQRVLHTATRICGNAYIFAPS